MKKSTMVVLSGGQDSTTCLLWARTLYEKVHAITFDYGQRHSREIDAAMDVGAIVGVDSHEIVDVTGLLRSTSPLTDLKAQLETYTNHTEMEAVIGDRVELTFVPLRNPLFLTVAANYALAKGCSSIVTGVCAMDNANYPDCTERFILSMEATINLALGYPAWPLDARQFNILTPLLHKSKADTVAMAMSYGDKGLEAMAHTHTCYAGKYPPCGECHACVLRAEGFRLAGVEDPLIVRSGPPRGVS
jgi:7-cyano-7-deazaguanine synthase